MILIAAVMDMQTRVIRKQKFELEDAEKRIERLEMARFMIAFGSLVVGFCFGLMWR